MKTNLTQILEERRLNYREQCGYQPNWGLRTPSVRDLEPEALTHCLKNPAAYEKKLWKMGNILFPSASFEAPFALNKPEFPKGFLASVPEKSAFYAALGRKLGGKVVPDSAVLPEGVPVVIFGSSAENRHAEKMGCLQKIFANGLYPGKGGWSLELPQLDMPTAVVCCDEESESAFLKHWESERTTRFCPGSGLPEVFHNPEKMLKLHVCNNIDAGDFDDFIAKVIAAFDCGGPEIGRDNGHCTMVSFVRCYYAYVCTGDRRFLEAFKAIFFGLVNYYLTLPGGASYISDYDFYLGSLINCFAAAESDAIFSEDDRLLGAAFLFSSFRLIEKYGKGVWPLRENHLRFNHETFPAMSCYWGGRYFGEKYNRKADAARWKFYAQCAFTEKNLSGTWRQKENSGSYQWIVPSQKLQWDLAEKGRPSPGFRSMARAVALITDNNGRQVCYGDCEPLDSFDHKDMLAALAQLTGDKLAAQLFSQMDFLGASPLPIPGWGHTLHPAPVPVEKMPDTQWQEDPLVPHILNRYPDAAQSRFDKVVFRDETRYLLFEPCSCDSHRHHDTGAILTFQYKGHLWLVDNGYGFDARHAPGNMVNAYASREIGPHCHNTVIFRDEDGKVILPPEFSLYYRDGDTLTCEITVAGMVWKRKLTLLDNGLKCIDTVQNKAADSVATVECQFNALGEGTLASQVWHLEQKGGRAELRFADSPQAQVSQDSYLTRGWEKVLGSFYPYAAGDVKQLRRILPAPAQGRAIRFESFFTVAGKE